MEIVEKVVDIILLHLRRVDQIEIKHKTSKLKKRDNKDFFGKQVHFQVFQKMLCLLRHVRLCHFMLYSNFHSVC